MLRLRTAILILIIPIGIGSSALIGYVAYHYTKKNIYSHLEKEIESTFISFNTTTQHLLKTYSGDLAVYGSFEIFQAYLKYRQYDLKEEGMVKKREIEDTFKRLTRIRDDYVASAFIDSKKRIIASYSSDPNYTILGLSEIRLYPAPTKKMSVSNVFTNVSGKKLLRIVYSISEGEEGGYLLLDIDCSRLLSKIVQNYLYPGGIVYFTDRDNKLFFVSPPGDYEFISEYYQKEYNNELGSGTIANGLNNINRHLFSKLYSLESVSWKMGFVVNEDAIYAPLKRIQFLGALAVILGIAGVFIISIILSRYISIHSDINNCV